MPHFTLEHTTNLPALDAQALLRAANQALFASGQFGAEIDIKSRAIPLDTFAVGTAGDGLRGFIHGKLAILSGRNAEIKRQLSEAVLAAIEAHYIVPTHMDVQISVEIVDLDRASYAKTAHSRRTAT
jgi:5-carboxymethyl-2-hydroxymuconate isomerase